MTFVHRDCCCLRALLIGVCVVTTPAVGAAAQRQGATLEGSVQDSSGAAVTGGAVTIRDTETNLLRSIPLLTPLSTFGRPIEASAARQIQFSIDFEF